MPMPEHHRHHSQIIGMYPLGVSDPGRSAAERRLVDGCLDDLVFKGPGEGGATAAGGREGREGGGAGTSKRVRGQRGGGWLRKGGGG